MKKKEVIGITLCLVSHMYVVLCIDILNGSYRNINIVIRNTVKEDDSIIERIKEIFTLASKFLFEASRHHVYFGNITIIIPNSWSEKSGYQKIPKLPHFDIMVDESNVIHPHTERRNLRCGSPGLYMYLPASFVNQTGKTSYGKHENVVVHEWGHLRWGLWDEYGMNGAKGTNGHFYLDDGKWKPVSCSESIIGKVGAGSQCKDTSECNTFYTKGLFSESCRFCPNNSQEQTNMSSIMAYNWLDAITTFCDNDTTLPEHQRHNKNSSSKQNDKCDSRSCWEVMRDHSDFKSALPLQASTNTTPTFIIKQETVGYRVFALDTSGSMNNNSRVTKMVKALEYIIKTRIPEYSFLGIVWFNYTASVVKHLTQLTSLAIRTEVLSALPYEADGGTCIGCGIDASLNILKQRLKDPAGSEIIVISDGENNVGNLNKSIQNAIDESVTLHSISISQAADIRMIEMATATGGKHVSYLEVGTIRITSAFLEILSSVATSDASDFVTLVSEQYPTQKDESILTSFYIESDIGNGTTIGVLQNEKTHLQINISGPVGISYTEEKIGDIIIINIPDKAITGQYNVSITTEATSLEIYVTSIATNTEAVHVFSWIDPVNFDFSTGTLPTIVAHVRKGQDAVLNLNVTAVVEATPQDDCIVSLTDDGLDPDDEYYDGKYASAIPAYCIGGDGRVIAQVYVQGEAGKAYSQVVYNGAASQNLDQDDSSFKVLEENFQRTVITNGILVKNFTVTDVTAPGRIKDVSIIDIATKNTQFGEKRNFTIAWTSTGDDVNIGQAMEYELRISRDKDILVNNFSNAELLYISNVNFTPKAAGSKEFIRMEISAEKSFTSTRFFAVRAKDEAGNKGAVSNIISILVADGYRMTVTSNVVFSHSEVENKARKEDLKEPENSPLAIILPLAAAVIVLAVIAIVVCVKHAKAKEIVENYEYGVPATTVSKMVFQPSQLEFHAESEQNYTNVHDSISFEQHRTVNIHSDNRSHCSELSNKSCKSSSSADNSADEHSVEIELDILPGK